MKIHKDLDVWKLAINFITDVYRVTSAFPKSEIYGLVAQLRRSGVSIASNIAEGAARQSKKEYIQFLHCALGSASETETQLIISYNLSYLDGEAYQALSEKQIRLSQMLSGLIRSLRKKS